MRGKDIKRYECHFADRYIIATFPSRHYNIDDYPAVRDYFLEFGRPRLEQNGAKGVDTEGNNARKMTSNQWFETQDAISYWDDFNQQKIVWGNLNLRATYAFADGGMMINAPSPIIVPSSNYLLGVLNSRLADYYIRSLGVTRNGGYFEYKPMFIKQLPVPIFRDEEQPEITTLVDERIVCRDEEEQAVIDRKIDEVVYRLYGLTGEEIDFIESQ